VSDPIDLPDEFSIERRRGSRRFVNRSKLEDELSEVTADHDEEAEVIEAPLPRPRGILKDQFGQSADQLRSFRQLLTTVRWATFVLAIALSINREFTLALGIAMLIVFANAVVRTFRPIVYRKSDPEGWLGILLELVIHLGAVVATGLWSSPFFFCLSAAIIAAGLGRGLVIGTVTGAGAATLLTALSAFKDDATAEQVLLGSSQLILLGVLAGYGNRLFVEARAQAAGALSRIGRLAEVNSLLTELHSAAQTLPMSLDLNETIDSTASRINSMLHPDAIVILLLEESTKTWRVAYSEGVRLPQRMTEAELPPALQALTDASSTVLKTDLGSPVSGAGLGNNTTTGLYAPLRARNHLVGLLALESRQQDDLGKRHLGLIDGLAEQIALAIDNARWFARLRTVGAEEERLRIARDLHDRVGQSLAYIAFELDRLTGQSETGTVTDELKSLRQDVRKVVTEVRETLYDLRTEVTDDSDLAKTLANFLERVRERAGLETTLETSTIARPPLLQERELWRIATEAITNVERHAQATKVSVRYSATSEQAILEITDNGKGFVVGKAGRADSYGMIGMRERADAIDATLELISEPGTGTTVRCVVNRRSLGGYDNT
jgi:signal transduction histidine kinase